MYIEIENDRVYFYDSFDYKEQIKLIFGRKWEKEIKAWSIPYTEMAVKEANQLLNCEIDLPKKRKTKRRFDSYFINHLYSHQKKSVEHLIQLPYSADLSQPGTGKTLTAIELMLQRAKFPALIICPKSIMEVVWEEELKKITGKVYVLSGSSAHVKAELEDHYLDGWSAVEPCFYIINYDKVDIVIDSLKLIEWGQIILDESTKIKSPSAKRSKAIIKLASEVDHKHIMTGTVAPNSLLDAFNQYKFLSPNIFGDSYFAFRQRFFKQLPWDQFNWYPKDDTYDKFRELTKDCSIQHLKKDCTDLPPLVEETRIYDLSADQHSAYQDMKRDALLVLNGLSGDTQVVTAPFKITEMMKLRQICSGFIYTVEDPQGYIFTSSKFAELEDLLDEIGNQKVIIFCHFNYSIQYLKSILIDSLAYLGGEKDKARALELFETDPDFKYLIANPASAGHGLNLQFCSNIIYFELDFNLENYLQSIDRINRIGQKNKMTVYYLLGRDTIEQYILRKLKKKETVNKKISVREIREAI